MSFYNVCNKCGANLDPGEKCTCEREAEERRKQIERTCQVSGKSNQFSFVFKEVDNDKSVAC